MDRPDVEGIQDQATRWDLNASEQVCADVAALCEYIKHLEAERGLMQQVIDAEAHLRGIRLHAANTGIGYASERYAEDRLEKSLAALAIRRGEEPVRSQWRPVDQPFVLPDATDCEAPDA